jgi:iron complex outermembrane receptor protein
MANFFKIRLWTSFCLFIVTIIGIHNSSFGQIISEPFQNNPKSLVLDSLKSDPDMFSIQKSKDTIEMNNGSFISPLEMIIGKIPGLMISPLNGMPGAEYDVKQLSAINSYVYGNAPIIIVDDMIFFKDFIPLNQNDIESIELLTGVDAAIYGEQAANGIILIKTKKSGNEFHVNYSGKISLSNVTKKWDVYSGDTYRDLLQTVYPGDTTLMNLTGNSNTDWQDEIFNPAFGHDQFIDILGLSKKIPLRLSFGRMDTKGVVLNSDFHRTTTSFSSNPNFFKDYLKLDILFHGVFNTSRTPHDMAVKNAVLFDPTQPVYQENEFSEYFVWTYQGSLLSLAPPNPVALINYSENTENSNNLMGNLKADYKFHFFPDLSIRLNAGYYQTKTNKNETIDKQLPFYVYGIGLEEISIQNNTYKHANISFYYLKQIPAIASSVMLNAGYSYHKVNESKSNIVSFSFRNSFYLNLKYALKERYHFQFSLRSDHNTFFPDEYPNALNPALSIGWNLKKEKFLINYTPISNLHIQYHYSKTGALQPPTNQIDIRDEQIISHQLNLGFGFLNNKLTGFIEVYKKEGRDIIKKIYIPIGSNLNNYIYQNVAYIENKGISFMINTHLIATQKISWNLGFSGNYNNNMIHSLNGFEIFEGNLGLFNCMIQKEGYPENSFFLLQQVYDSNGLPIENMYVDKNENGQIDDEDFLTDKKQAPDFIGGIHSRLVFHNWEIAFSGRLSLGNYVYNYPNNFGVSDNLHNNYWYLSNIPVSFEETQFQFSQIQSDIYLENASFFKIDYISVGHRFDDLFNGKMDLQVSAIVNHAFTITEYSGHDPEINNGIDNITYPHSRTYTLGFDIRL